MCVTCCNIKKNCILPAQCICVFCVVLSQWSSYLNIILFAFVMEIQHEVEKELLSTCLYELLIFMRVQKIAKSDSFVMSICPSTLNHLAPTGWIFMKFYIRVLVETLSRKFKFCYNLTRIMDTSCKDQYIFMFISHSVLLRVRCFRQK